MRENRLQRLHAQASAGASLELPREVVQGAIRRLRVAALLLASLAIVNFSIFTFVLDHSPLSRIDMVCMPALIFASIAVVVLTRSSLPPHVVVRLGLLYEIVAAFLLGMLVNEGPWPVDRMMPSWSPVAMWLVVFPLLVPTPWRVALLLSIFTALMDPATLGLAVWLGAPPPSPEIALARFTPTLLSIALGTVTAHVVYRLGATLGEARRAGSYELMELLGQGGMGEVWRARHRMLARPAAVKLIRPSAIDTTEELSSLIGRFEQEAQATASLQSPHTVALYDYGVTDERRLYYVMELLDGFDLDRLVTRFGPTPAERAVYLLKQVCHSLAEAHSLGMVHRDIKPANLFTCQMGLDYDFVKVLDFGLVKRRHAPGDGSVLRTREDTLTGTPAYFAPELALSSGTASPASDIYSLGCVAYWLVCGELVFEAKTALAMITKHTTDAPTPPSERTELPVPADLEALILQCLDKSPEARPHNALELGERLGTLESSRVWTQERARQWWAANAPRPDAPKSAGT